MKTSHTLGTWEVSKHATPEYAPQYGVYAKGCRQDHCIVRYDNAEANARLIAAAPDLLEVLKSVGNGLFALRHELADPQAQEVADMEREIEIAIAKTTE